MDFSSLNLDDNQILAREIILRAAKLKIQNRHDFEKFRNGIVKEFKGEIFHNLYLIKAYRDLVKEKKISENKDLLDLIQKRSVRTMSGVAPVTVLMKPFPCPGRCVYCPTDVRMPKSYLITQPAAQRAFRQKFDPYAQVFVRLKALHITGHEVSKVELRIIGGTFSSYKKNYQTWFIKRCLQAMNEFQEKLRGRKGSGARVSFGRAVKENETGPVRSIGINIETRPDFLNEKEIGRLRELGVTKVEIGVQTTDDKVQALTKRGHGLEAVKKATRLLKDAGLKVGYHMMPNLPGSTVELDKRMVADLFRDGDYQPDYLKIYPCVVIEGTELSTWFKLGKFEPYDDKILEAVLLAEMRDVPEWCRIDRVARDIPAGDIEAGFKVSNIRQLLEERLRKAGTPCRDIRSREIGDEIVERKNIILVKREYEASGGRELFLSFEDKKSDKLVALLRLRFPGRTFLSELDGAAIIREVHVYGRQVAVGEHTGEKQHIGWGRKLMNEAEKLARLAGFERIAVIAGIGTREYYKKLGYRRKGTYVLKDI